MADAEAEAEVPSSCEEPTPASCCFSRTSGLRGPSREVADSGTSGTSAQSGVPLNYDEIIDVKAHHSNCLTALTGTSMHRINEMLEKLINQLRRQFRQTLDLVGSLLRKEEGHEDFCFFFEEACCALSTIHHVPFLKIIETR